MKAVWRWWKRVAHRIGDFQARVILILFYFVVLGPFALAVRWKFDPLAMKPGAPRGWLPRVAAAGSVLDHALRQS